MERRMGRDGWERREGWEGKERKKEKRSPFFAFSPFRQPLSIFGDADEEDFAEAEEEGREGKGSV